MIGKTVSHYRILEKLGEGGMGVVYRAHDTSLNRDVAIKVLPDSFVSDPERKARFTREAKILAALSAPNIAAIYGLEEAEGKPYLVLELVEGPTLADRLKKGRIPVDETLDICNQIAEGLEAAHEKGIIHRDLKPANVKITPEGKVKVLDFGLAKAFCEQPAAADPSKSPTITDEMTSPGVILGTAAYMSPEQARGKTVDKRTDIWAFGCVLYECLTGKRAFEGETITETVASILKSDPDWTLLPLDTPAIVRSLLRRCLQKDLGRRLHDIADGRVEMLEGLSEAPAAGIPVVHRSPLAWVLLFSAASLAIGIFTGPMVMKLFRPSILATPPAAMRSLIRMEPGLWLEGFRLAREYQRPSSAAMVLSSDGRFLVYSAVKENPGAQDKPHLYLRRFDLLEAKAINGTEGGIGPILSPDDRWVGFWADRKLMKVPVEGGVATLLCEIGLPLGMSWGVDGYIYFTQRTDLGILRVPAGGGKAETLTKPDRSKDEYSHRLPHCLPNGKRILFTVMRSYNDLNPHMAVMEFATRKLRVLMEDAADGRCIASGHLVFLRRGTLMAAPCDLERMEVTGPAISVVSDVMQALNSLSMSYNSAAGQFSVSDIGSLIYASGGILPDPKNSLVWVDQQGNSEPIVRYQAPFFAPRCSPDGRWIAYRTMGMERLIWIYDLSRGTASKITSEGNAGYLTWSRDSRSLIFGWSKGAVSNLHLRSADGSMPMERLATSENGQSVGSLSPDGLTLLLHERNPDSGLDIMLLRLQDRKVSSVLNSRSNESNPEFSPDGRWMAYVSDETGRREVYIQPFPGPGGKMQISSDGGNEPLWSRDGRQLFYWRPDQVWVVDIQSGAAFAAGKPRLLFEKKGGSFLSEARAWDISPDGKRFLMVEYEERKPQPVTELILVHDWFEELRRLVPTGKN